MGGGDEGGRFPATRPSALLGALSDDLELRRVGWERLARAYHPPVYTYLRVRWRKEPDDAADLAQAFFERLLERPVLDAYDPARGRFRTYLRLTLDRFVQDRRREHVAQKRGGALRALAESIASVEAELARRGLGAESDPEALFQAESARQLLALALEALREHCARAEKEEHFAIFERYCFDPDPSYEALASELDVSVVILTHRLAYARRHFRRLALELLRDVTATDEEYRLEARALLGVELS